MLSQEPTRYTWQSEPDHTAGVGRWSFLDIWPDRVELAVILPPGQPTIARHNALLCTLVLSALRPDWITAGDWFAAELRMAARAAMDGYAGTNYSRGVTFAWDKSKCRGVLTIRRYTEV